MAYTEQPRSNPSDATSSGEPLGRRLDSWKEIASYLNRSEKTVRRWEEDNKARKRRIASPGEFQCIPKAMCERLRVFFGG